MALGDPFGITAQLAQQRTGALSEGIQGAANLFYQEKQKQDQQKKTEDFLKQTGILKPKIEQPILKDWEDIANKTIKNTYGAELSLKGNIPDDQKIQLLNTLFDKFGIPKPQPKQTGVEFDYNKAAEMGLDYSPATGTATVKPQRPLPTLAQQIQEVQALDEAKKRGDISPNTGYAIGKGGLQLKSSTQKSGVLAQLGIETENKDIEQLRNEVSSKNPSLYTYLKKVGNNELPVRGSFGMSYNQVTEIVSALFPEYDPTQYPAKEKVRQSFTSGKEGSNIRSLNTATEHLGELYDLIPTLGNGNLMKANSIKNWTTRNIGQPGVARFNFVKAALSGELATLFKNSGGTDQEIDNLRQAIDTADSPKNLYDTLKGATHLMQGRMGALDWQWKTAFGEDSTFPIMSENSKKTFSKVSGGQQNLTNGSELPNQRQAPKGAIGWSKSRRVWVDAQGNEVK